MSAAVDIVLSADEVCSAARLTGCLPPDLFDAGWVEDEVGVADAVALRGMLARGFAEVRDEGVVLGWIARATLGPVLRPECRVEVIAEPAGGVRRRFIAAESADGVVVAEEQRPAMWRMEHRAEAASGAARPTVFALVDNCAVDRHVGPDVLVPDQVLAAAHTLLAQDGAAVLPAMLHARGLPEDSAELLAALLIKVVTTVTVRTWSRIGPAAYATAAIMWLDAGPMGSWLAVAGQPAGDPDDETDACATRFTPTDRESLRTVLLDLLEEGS